ncbi:major capsid protein [Bacillus phage Anath]|uniref:Major capsid protein n=1 Tax=Bacillus phage Anath TaxID=2108114 RepID=A0A2P1JUJ4_9CAUD|nr:major capsid protein [Bacillus phage Anath]
MADIVLGQHQMLKKEFVDKRIRGLIGHNFKADFLFTSTTINALSGKYYEDADKDANGRQAYDDVPQVGENARFDRIGLSEVEKTFLIKKYGLETVISLEQQKFGGEGYYERAYRKLALNVLKMVDTMAYEVATNKYTVGNGILGKNSAKWTTADILIGELVDAKVASSVYGYELDTVVANPLVMATLLKTKDIRDAFRQNNTDVALLRGYIGDFMGLTFIQDENFVGKDVLLVQKKVIGEIADAEGLRTKVYSEEAEDRTIVRATRYTQAYLTDPKAVYLLKAVIA